MKYVYAVIIFFINILGTNTISPEKTGLNGIIAHNSQNTKQPEKPNFLQRLYDIISTLFRNFGLIMAKNTPKGFKSTYRIPVSVIRSANAKISMHSISNDTNLSSEGIVAKISYAGRNHKTLISREKIKSAFKNALEKYGKAV